MTRSRRSLRWIAALAAATLLPAGVWFYQAYFSSNNAAIRHAEAFLFRRMSVSQLAEQGEYRFFFATNREQDESGEKASLLEQFGATRQEQLTFGYFDATIQPSLGLGMLLTRTGRYNTWY